MVKKGYCLIVFKYFQHICASSVLQFLGTYQLTVSYTNTDIWLSQLLSQALTPKQIPQLNTTLPASYSKSE